MFRVLDGEIAVGEAFAEDLRQGGTLPHAIQGRADVVRQLVAAGPGRTDHRRARFYLAEHAEIAAGQRGGQHQIGVGVGPGQPVLDPGRRRGGNGHPQADGAVVRAPIDVDRRRAAGLVAKQATIGVHVGRQQRHGGRQIALQAADEMVEQGAGLALFTGKQVVALGVDQALVNVHRAARLVGHRLGHEGRVHAVAQRRLPEDALEHDHLVRQRQRVAVLEVDFHLAGAFFVDQRVQVEMHCLAVVVHLLEQRIELVDRVDGERLTAALLAPGATDRRLERVVGVDVGLDQIELDLGGDHRAPASLFVEFQNALQHVAGRQVDRLARQVVAVVDDLGGGVFRPGHQKGGIGVGHQLHVPFGGIPEADVLVVRVTAGDGLDEDGVRQSRPPSVEILAGRHDLALENAGEIGHQTLDFGNAVLLKPVLER